MRPGAIYNQLYNSGELTARIGHARKILESCELCPRHCHVNRLHGEMGKCYTGSQAVVSS